MLFLFGLNLCFTSSVFIFLGQLSLSLGQGPTMAPDGFAPYSHPHPMTSPNHMPHLGEFCLDVRLGSSNINISCFRTFVWFWDIKGPQSV